jgi:hypothetical protein
LSVKKNQIEQNQYDSLPKLAVLPSELMLSLPAIMDASLTSRKTNEQDQAK